MSKTIYRAVFAVMAMMLVSQAASAQSRDSVSAAEVNGTFEMNFRGKFKEFSNGIKILALGGGKLRVAMDLVYPYSLKNGEPMVHLGTFDDTFSIVGDTASYTSEDGGCKMTIKFVKQGTIQVNEDSRASACGFGQNVTSNGTYKKVSSKKPKFESEP